MMFIVKASQKYFLRNQVHLGEINGHVEEIYAGHNIVKVYNAEKGAKERFDEINGKLYESNWKSQFLSGLMMPLMNFIGNFGYVVVCVVGAVLAKNGMDFGIIVAFLVYIRLFTQPLAQIAQAANDAAVDRCRQRTRFRIPGRRGAGRRVAQDTAPGEHQGRCDIRPCPLRLQPG